MRAGYSRNSLGCHFIADLIDYPPRVGFPTFETKEMARSLSR